MKVNEIGRDTEVGEGGRKSQKLGVSRENSVSQSEGSHLAGLAAGTPLTGAAGILETISC